MIKLYLVDGYPTIELAADITGTSPQQYEEQIDIIKRASALFFI